MPNRRRLEGHAIATRGTALVLAVAALTACGSSPNADDSFDFGDAAPVGDGGGPEDSSSPATILQSPDMTDCPPAAKLIYVTGEGAKLYSLDPEAGKFTLIGTFNCLTTPTHMTVDRNGTAWVVGQDVVNGIESELSPVSLYRASTTDATCSQVSTWTPDPAKFTDLALTFLGTTNEVDTSLYILGESGELAVFDTASGLITSRGDVKVSPYGDMTTNGDGTLYFLIQATTQTLNQIDPASASILASYTTGENSENTQALAFYGGLFYDFIGSDVYTYDVQTKTTRSIGTAPLLVTGAGQSTCVPTAAPPPPILH